MLMAAAASTCVRTKRFPVTQVSPQPDVPAAGRHGLPDPPICSLNVTPHKLALIEVRAIRITVPIGLLWPAWLHVTADTPWAAVCCRWSACC